MSKKDLTPAAKRRRLIKIAAAAGGSLGVLCHLLPPNMHDVCQAVTKAASIAIGGC